MKVTYCPQPFGSTRFDELPKDHGIKDGVPNVGHEVVHGVPGGNIGYTVVRVVWNRTVRTVFVFLKATHE